MESSIENIIFSKNFKPEAIQNVDKGEGDSLVEHAQCARHALDTLQVCEQKQLHHL